jgi:hypothetical protein
MLDIPVPYNGRSFSLHPKQQLSVGTHGLCVRFIHPGRCRFQLLVTDAAGR